MHLGTIACVVWDLDDDDTELPRRRSLGLRIMAWVTVAGMVLAALSGVIAVLLR